MANETRLTAVPAGSGGAVAPGATSTGRLLVTVVLALLVALTGCESDEDCINCVELPPPVVPTGVHSISGDNEVIVQWFDIAYAPYDDSYNENVTTYYVYSRFYENGDEFNFPDREFDPIGEVDWDENYDPSSGLHWFIDRDVVNGQQYEYAIAAVNAAGRRSALSFEFVADAPLPMSQLDAQGWFIPLEIFDANDTNAALSGFDFRRAGLNPGIPTAGRVEPVGDYNIKIGFEGQVAYAMANNSTTRIQDFGVFTTVDDLGVEHLVFEGVGWAPANGYSGTGKLEMVVRHVYVVEIIDGNGLHYAKFGIDGINTNDGSVDLIWAYQLIGGLPELKATGPKERTEVKPQLIKM